MVDWIGPLTRYFGSLTLPLQLGIVYALVYPLGSLAWSYVTSHSNLPRRFSIELPFRIATGLTISSVLTFLLGLIWLPLGLAVLVASWFALFGKGRHLTLKPVSIAKLSKVDLTFLGLAIFWTALGCSLVWNQKWPPAGDSVLHGMIVSAALQQGRTPSTLAPISAAGNLLTSYPLGFHTLAASLDYALALPSGQIILLLALAASLLLPLLAFALTYYLSNSLVAGLISNLAFLLPSIPSGRFLETFPLGYLYNGVYPAILATVILLSIIGWASLHLRTAPRRTLIFVTSLSTLALLITYPPFALFPIAVAVLSQVHGNARRIGVISALGIATFLLTPNMKSILAPTGFGTPANLVAYGLSIPYFSANLGLVATLTVGLSYGVFLAVKRRSVFGGFALALVAIILGSLNPAVYSELIWFTAPSRLFITLLISGFILLGIFLSRIFNKVTQNGALASKRKLITFLLAASIITLIGWSAVIQVSTASRTWWNPYDNDDWKAVQWIDHNVPADSLLLNDPSYAGVYVTSLSAREVVNNLFFTNNMFRANEIFDRPWDQQLQKAIFAQFPIRFVYVSSDPVYWNSVTKSYLTGLPRGLLENALDFSNYLKPVFQSGDAKIYEVASDAQTERNNYLFPLGNAISVYSEAQNSNSTWNYDNTSLNVVVTGHWVILQSASPISFNATTYPRLLIAANSTSNASFGIWMGNTTLVSNIFLHSGDGGLFVEEFDLSKLGPLLVAKLGFEVGTTTGGTATVNWLLVGLATDP